MCFIENKAIGIMRPGHTFTIEPMINIGLYINSIPNTDRNTLFVLKGRGKMSHGLTTGHRLLW